MEVARARRSAMQSINANNLCSELIRPDCAWQVAAVAVAKSQVIEIYVLVSGRAARHSGGGVPWDVYASPGSQEGKVLPRPLRDHELLGRHALGCRASHSCSFLSDWFLFLGLGGNSSP